MRTGCQNLYGSVKVLTQPRFPGREIIDQLAKTGTYVTRDGDDVLRHWNGITDALVGSEADPTDRMVIGERETDVSEQVDDDPYPCDTCQAETINPSGECDSCGDQRRYG